MHAGVLFPPEYEPHGVRMLYEGNAVELTAEQVPLYPHVYRTTECTVGVRCQLYSHVAALELGPVN